MNFKLMIASLAVGILTGGFGAKDALALPEFKKAFTEAYAEKHKSKDFQAAVKKASCNVCHVKGAKKDVQNEYGKLLNKLIEGDAKNRKSEAKEKDGKAGETAEKEKILAELTAAFKKLNDTRSGGDPKSEKAPTYGELIKEGKLPVDPEEAAAKYKEEQAKKEAEGEK